MNNYWKLKAAVLTRQLSMAQLQAEAQKVEAAYAEAMKAEGLDASDKPFVIADPEATATESVNWLIVYPNLPAPYKPPFGSFAAPGLVTP